MALFGQNFIRNRVISLATTLTLSAVFSVAHGPRTGVMQAERLKYASESARPEKRDAAPVNAETIVAPDVPPGFTAARFTIQGTDRDDNDQGFSAMTLPARQATVDMMSAAMIKTARCDHAMQVVRRTQLGAAESRHDPG